MHFKSDSAGIAPNSRAEITFKTNNKTTSNYNKDIINRTYLTPSQTFARGDVTTGTYLLYDTVDADFEGNMPSVMAEAKITVSYGYATSSTISVEQLDQATLTAPDAGASATSGGTPNYIVNSSASDIFRYTMTVYNSGGSTSPSPMKKFVLVCNLPEQNDFSALYNEFARYSEYRVDFASADKLNPSVSVTTQAGETKELDESAYTLLFSAQTSLDVGNDANAGIWQCAELGAKDGWYTLAEIEASDALALSDMRTVRLAIADAQSIITAKATVALSLNAQMSAGQDETDASQTAWASFGYWYQVGSYTLQSATAEVGVRTPGVPQMQKRLVDYTGGAWTAGADEQFTFLIYTGESLGLDAALGEGALMDALEAEGRKFTRVTLDVAAGQSASAEVPLSGLRVWARDDAGAWAAGDAAWSWDENSRYTVLEVIDEAEGDYFFGEINGIARNNYTFGYVASSVEEIDVVNTHEYWNINIVKKCAETGQVLQGATFAIYSANPADALVNVGSVEGASAAKQRLEIDGDIWYLMDVQKTSGTGKIAWAGLGADTYYVLELAAPEGYAMGSEPGQMVAATWDGARTTVVEVPNYTAYTLPNSGGCGTWPLIAAGCALLLAACALFRARCNNVASSK
jgi:hypothetical protein